MPMLKRTSKITYNIEGYSVVAEESLVGKLPSSDQQETSS